MESTLTSAASAGLETGLGEVQRLPLFLLGLVLFPRGMLRLQVFEQRYLRMVKEAMRTGGNFGVCLVATQQADKGQAEPKQALGFATIGCKAQIIDFDTTERGLLQIDCRGTERFRVLSHDVEEDGLVIAQVQTLAPDAEVPVPNEFYSCSSLVQELVKEIEKKLASQASRMIDAPYQFDSSSWVSNRLCELLPVSMATRQSLMALADPIQRLGQVDLYLRDQSLFFTEPNNS